MSTILKSSAGQGLASPHEGENNSAGILPAEIKAIVDWMNKNKLALGLTFAGLTLPAWPSIASKVTQGVEKVRVVVTSELLGVDTRPLQLEKGSYVTIEPVPDLPGWNLEFRATMVTDYKNPKKGPQPVFTIGFVRKERDPQGERVVHPLGQLSGPGGPRTVIETSVDEKELQAIEKLAARTESSEKKWSIPALVGYVRSGETLDKGPNDKEPNIAQVVSHHWLREYKKESQGPKDEKENSASAL